MFEDSENTANNTKPPKQIPPELLGGREVEFNTMLRKWFFTDTNEVFTPPVRKHGTIPIATYIKG